MASNDISQSSSEFSSFLKVYGIVMVYFILSGVLALTAGKALEEQRNLVIFTIASIPILAYVLFLTITLVTKAASKADWFVVFLHNPKLSPLGMFDIVRNPLKLFILSIIMFSLLGFAASFSQNTIGQSVFPWAPGSELQQVTPQGKFLFGIYNTPSEQSWLYLILTAITSMVLFVAARLKISLKAAYLGVAIPLCMIFGTLVWFKIHSLITGQTIETGIFVMSPFVVFGFFNTALVMLTGSIIPSEVYHLINNIYRSVRENFGNENVVVAFSILMAIIFIFVALYFGLGKMRRKK